MPELQTTQTEQKTALNSAVDRYCDDCLGRVDSFVSAHLKGRSAWAINCQALGWDLIRVPLNIAWAPIWLLLQLLGLLCDKLKMRFLAEQLKRMPAGMRTAVQSRLSVLIEVELLQASELQPDPMLAYLSPLAGVDEREWHRALEASSSRLQAQQFTARLFGARTAVAELTSGLGMTAVGALVFKQFTPGAIGGGAALASWWSYKVAAANFWAGDKLGGLWYQWFPPAVEWGTRFVAIAALMLVLALAASLSGFVTDPLQSLLGLHQRRLRSLIEQLRKELKSELLGDNSTREQYLARVADIADWMVIAAGKTAG